MKMGSAILAAVLFAATPADDVRAALADVQSLPVEARIGLRYLTTAPALPEDRKEQAAVASYALNAVSRSRVITRPVQISATLWRFDVVNYAGRTNSREWFTAWENLTALDPYFHLTTQVADAQPAKIVKGKPASVAVPRTVQVAGGWADPTAHQQLANAVGSNLPIVRADWMVNTILTAPAYYELSGVPPIEKDFTNSLGLDANTLDKLRANSGANLVQSNVTNKPRRIIFSQGPFGGYYQTLDQATATADRDPIRRPVSDGGLFIAYDASEIFAVAPNGLLRVAVFTSDGKRVNTVQDKIAKDTSDPLGDGVVTAGVSCLRCHQEGLRPFRDDQSRLLSGAIELRSYDPAVVERALEFYSEPRLQRQLKFDRETFAEAVNLAGGFRSPQAAAESLGNVVRAFAYVQVSLADAARELGTDAESLGEKLAAGSRDPLLLRMAVLGEPILRSQFEVSYQEAALVAAKP